MEEKREMGRENRDGRRRKEVKMEGTKESKRDGQRGMEERGREGGTDKGGKRECSECLIKKRSRKKLTHVCFC